MSFAQSTYSVNETDELVEIEIILSDPSSTNITVQVASSDINATGKQSSYLSNCIIFDRQKLIVMHVVLSYLIKNFPFNSFQL